ncbi:alpha/beta-hydrolase [Thozetella sp. PMI_491]|nr:alpha/beta-hydrolase [Thozetella sp. PMI_491]
MANAPSLSPLLTKYRKFSLESGNAIHQWHTDTPRGLLLLQHGFGEYTERYVRSKAGFIPKLNASGFEVWALDLQGHGDSPGDGCLINVELATQDHVELRRRAAAQGLPLFLFGHSLGGLITAGSAVHDPLGIAGIILCSPGFPAQTTPVLVEMALRLLSWLVPHAPIPKARTPADRLVHSTEQARLIEADPKLLKGQVSFLSAATALRTSKMVWASLKQWRTPTLVIHGTDDITIDPKTSAHFVEMIASSDKTLYLDEGGYHDLLCDRNSQKIVELISQWLNVRL